MSNGRDLLTKTASIFSFKSFVNYKVNERVEGQFHLASLFNHN